MGETPPFKLNTGVNFPPVGFGTWKLAEGDEARSAVLEALKTGYRLIDTASQYGNEKSVGEAIKESKLPREEILVTTKLANRDQGYESGFEALDASLKRLGLEYINLYLIHWPQPSTRKDSWKSLQEIYKEGRAKSIGVSNYTIAHLEELLADSDIVPAVNQVEFHPFIYENQKELLAYCKDKGILIEAYSPLAHAEDLRHPLFQDISERYNKSSAQIMLRWALQHGTLPIPKSAHAERIKENFELFDFELDDGEMEAINNLSNGQRVTWDPTDLP